MKKNYRWLLAFWLAMGVAPVYAQSATDEIAKYREMIADGNPDRKSTRLNSSH